MTAEELWNEYARKAGIEHTDYEAWAFGDATDELAGLAFDEDMLVVCEEFSCVYTRESY